MAYAGATQANIQGANIRATVAMKCKSLASPVTYYAGEIALIETSSGLIEIVKTTVPTTAYRFAGLVAKTITVPAATVAGANSIEVAHAGDFVMTISASGTVSQSHVGGPVGVDTGGTSDRPLMQSTFRIGTVIERLSATVFKMKIDAFTMTGANLASA